MILYKIARWGELFENNRSRSVKDLNWVSVPNRHDGEHYTAIVTHKDGAVLFSAWNLLIQVASKCNPRGWLVKDSGKPHTPESLSLKTRAPADWFKKTFDFLASNTDWLEYEDVAEDYQPPVSLLTLYCEEGKGMEGKGKKGREGNNDLPAEAETWNLLCDDLPKISSLSPGRMKHLRSRRQDRFWVSNYADAVVRISKSEFCNGKNDRGWRADFDFILKPDSVAKIMEGKYDNREPKDGKLRPRREVVEIPILNA